MQLALARRGAARQESHWLAVADLVLDEDAHQVWRGATEVHLTATEFTRCAACSATRAGS